MTWKWWTKIGLVVLIALVFCMWYTRPRSFRDFIGDEPVASIAGLGLLFQVEHGTPKSQSWTMDYQSRSEEILEGLLELAESCQYRVRLRNLLPVWRETELEIGVPRTTVYATLGKDGAGSIAAEYTKNRVTIWVTSSGGKSREFLASSVDRELAERLYEYMEEYGISGSAS